MAGIGPATLSVVHYRRCEMSTEKLVETLGKHIGRRVFLKSLGASTFATLLALLGHPVTVSASHPLPGDCQNGTSQYKCCHLCCTPGGSCSGGCPTSTAHGQWCWSCYYAVDNRDYRCCECKNPNSSCAQNCNGVYRSYYYRLGTAPEPAG